MRRLVLWLLGLAAGAYLLVSLLLVGFEVLRPVPEPTARVADDAPPREVAEAWGLRPGGLFASRGYTGSIGAETDDWEYGVLFRRGPVDRKRATYPLSVRYGTNTPGGLAKVSLYVTSEREFPELEGQTPVASVVPIHLDEYSVAWFRNVPVPADTRLFQVLAIGNDGHGFSMGHSVPRAETWAGRVYDRYAWWPIFRWLPLGE